MQFVDIGGVTLHFAHRPAAGSGRHLVFINSLGTDFRIWNEVADALAGNISTLTYDKRGHGLSDIGSAPYSMEDHVDDLIGLVDRLGIRQIVLCGLSVGGLVALGFYKRRPEMVDGILLCDTAHKIGTVDGWNARIATVEKSGIDTIADGIMKVWFTPSFHTERKAELAAYRNMLVRQAVAGYAGTCAALRDADYTEVARNISVPTLCLAGDQDGSTPPELVRATADLIPGARFEIIEYAGHIPCVEQPAALTGRIRKFLSELSSGEGYHG
ncbi:3-oxoadipate enol-lactonase [Pseudaminobacter arsenicus]|uniref:3-oxoadipate enol-lactonase n=1 Tax=Borborobacter arsenicus TaxID=1851146 RepID=A0A432V834_9HYPH|nr:3-oxoadipate enol-lactonase [Pseudaminobacter arsenicus]RUM98213.1 3-oxoadipate enol-lactonase [Pseudaminobacter arsenicus]